MCENQLRTLDLNLFESTIFGILWNKSWKGAPISHLAPGAGNPRYATEPRKLACAYWNELQWEQYILSRTSICWTWCSHIFFGWQNKLYNAREKFIDSYPVWFHKISMECAVMSCYMYTIPLMYTNPINRPLTLLQNVHVFMHLLRMKDQI